MQDLVFDPETHTYTVAGTELPGITSLLKPLTDYDKVPEFMLQRKAEFGKAVHEAVEYFLTDGGIEEDQYSEAELLCFSGFLKFWKDHQHHGPRSVEQPMSHPKLKYAGTPDLIIDGVCIIEIKTRLYNMLTDPMQLVAQENLWIANGGQKGPYQKFVLELHKDGTYKLVPALNGQAWPKFRYLLDHYWNCIDYAQKIQAWRKK